MEEIRKRQNLYIMNKVNNKIDEDIILGGLMYMVSDELGDMLTKLKDLANSSNFNQLNVMNQDAITSVISMGEALLDMLDEAGTDLRKSLEGGR